MNRRSLLTLLVALLPGCKMLAGLPAKATPNQVILLGTLGEDHLTEEVYTLARLERLIRAVDPRVVLVEVPPDRFPAAWSEFVRTGEVTDEHLRGFPEITEVLFPLALEGRLKLVPVSAWTRQMAERRARLLAQWETTRPEDTRQVRIAREAAERRLEEEGLAHDPLAIHTARFDEVVAEGIEPYDRLFGRDLGPGGWTQLNQAHARRIAEALDAISGDGKRVLVVFGAWHKGRLREGLEQRADIRLRRLADVLPASELALP